MASPAHITSPEPDSDALCDACSHFTQDVIAFNFQPQETYPSRWATTSPFPSSWGPGFPHHESIQALHSSADNCSLCAVLSASFAAKNTSFEGRLFLFPFASYGRRQPREFTGSFDVTRNFLSTWGVQNHVFTFGRRRSWDTGVSMVSPEFQRRWKREHERDFLRAVPRSSSCGDSRETARFWLMDCVEGHPECERGATPLPTRVIDVGGVHPRLFVSNGEIERYAALSHCWGGNIPCKLTQEDLAAYERSLPMERLPANFRDAIDLTRDLGIRYLWIDALCIIQDSAQDWATEAAKMASVYSNAVVTISTLNSDKSTMGFSKQRPSKCSIVSADFVVQENLPTLLETLEDSPLNSRGWCMQERLLSPALLHIAKHQLYWECRAGYGSENGDFTTHDDRVSSSFNRTTHKFVALRKKFTPEAWQGWDTWCRLVTEYTTRDLSFEADKFPALAGAAEVFQRGSDGAEYVAGLWRQDLARGLLWGAHSIRLPAQKAAGFSKCHVLKKPNATRAPSWSWASVDGPVEFFGAEEGEDFRVLGVDMEGGVNDLGQTTVEGSVRVRARIALMEYNAPTYGEHVGSLSFEKRGQSLFSFVVLDFERMRERQCWVLLTGGTSPNCLLLERDPTGFFQRIGLAVTYGDVGRENLSRFEMDDIVLV